MPIKHAIVHKIERNKPSGKVNLTLRPNELKSDGPIVSLVEQLKATFVRSTQRQYGAFDPEQTDNPFSALVDKWLDSQLGFPTFSHQLMQHLVEQLEKQPEPFSAHLLMVAESQMEQEFLYLFWINHTEAQFIDNELDTRRLEFIETSRLSYAVKIDIEQRKVDGWDQYLTLLTARGQKEISAAFTRFSGFLSQIDLKQQTEKFLVTLDGFVEAQEHVPAEKLKQQVVDYCVEQDKTGLPVDLSELSKTINDEHPDQFSDYIKQQAPDFQPEIYTDRNQLKKHVKFFGRDSQLSINFSSDMLGNRVAYDAEQDQLTIHDIPKSLKAQLLRFLKRQAKQASE